MVHESIQVRIQTIWVDDGTIYNLITDTTWWVLKELSQGPYLPSLDWTEDIEHEHEILETLQLRMRYGHTL